METKLILNASQTNIKNSFYSTIDTHKNTFKDYKKKYHNHLIIKENFNNTFFTKRFYLLLYLIIFFILFSQNCFCKAVIFMNLNNDNCITIIIQGTGALNILSEQFSNTLYPNKIRINDDAEITDNINKIQNLPLESNRIILTWNSQLSSCKSMFRYLSNIISIDLSEFDFALVESLEFFCEGCSSLQSIDFRNGYAVNVITMNQMLKGCTSLTNINFNNFQTNKLETLVETFYQCTSLESIDLSSYNTPNLKSLITTFKECTSLTYITFGNFDTSKVTDMTNMFHSCSSFESLDLSIFNTESVILMNDMFSGCQSLKNIDLSSFNTSSVKSMIGMFYNCNQLESLDLSNFDTTSVTMMKDMFSRCYSLNSINLCSFKTPSLTSTQGMFYFCENLNSLDLSSFNTEKITTLDSMFSECHSLTYLNLNNFYTPSLILLNGMFYNCWKLESLDISNFNTTLVTQMTNMFSGCKSITSINFDNFNTQSLTITNSMFYYCDKLTSLNLSSFNMESVEYMIDMFRNCNSLTCLDLSNFKTPSLKSTKCMFYNCTQLQSLDISNLDTTKVESMLSMFDLCYSIKSLNLSNFYTPSLTNFYHMFYSCRNLEYLDISNFNTDKITSMNNIFHNCFLLTSINIRNFNTSLVEDMEGLFSECHNLISVDLGSFNTESVKIMTAMFYGCHSLKSLDLNNFYTPNLENMLIMFENCYALESLDTSTNFDTSKITDMSYIFKNCRALKSLDISNFDTSSVTSMSEMFFNCYQLSSLNIIGFNTESVQKMNYMFYNCYSLEYLDISNFNIENVDNMANMFEKTESLLFLNLTNFDSLNTLNYENIFNEINPNITLCYDESTIPSDFFNIISQYENICKKVCILNSKKYIIDEEMCVNNCYDETEYNKEYQNICYKQCPAKTQPKLDISYLCENCRYYYNYEQTDCLDEIPQGYYNNDTSSKTIDKCPNKCFNCSKESMIDNLCISCNTNKNFFLKLNDTNNINTYVECYNKDEEQIGYYLDNEENIFKQCYYKCNKYNGEGNDTYNNCIDCLDIYSYDNGTCFDKYEYIYSYDINSNSEEAKKDFNHTYIEISQETIDFLKKKYSLKNEDKIFVTISENTANDSNTATVNYDYIYYLENGTILNLSEIDEDIYVDVYVPIKDLELAKFNLTKEYAEQGYDIYDINNIFYTDFCTPATLGDNDITLEDRKKDIYPTNVTLCKSNCKYSGVNIEEQRVICSCNLNSEKEEEIEESQEEDDGNFITYFLDNINYKIFVCYDLFFNFNNLKKSYYFYILIGIFSVLQIINLIYFCCSLRKLKKTMLEEAVNNKNVIKEIISKKHNTKVDNNHKKGNPNKKKENKKKKKFYKNFIKSKKESIQTKTEKNTFIFLLNDKHVNNINNIIPAKKHQNIKSKRKTLSKKMKKNIYIKSRRKKEVKKDNKEDNINDSPFSRAVKNDKRNIFQIFYSFIIEKLELISILCSDARLKLILIIEYVLSLVINFFFNSLLYTDDVVSNKYHNNGELDFFVSLTLSLVSNIVTSIICYYMKYSRGIEERIDLILEIKYTIYYFVNIKKLFQYLRLKFIFFLIAQLVIFSTCIYYLVIFCTIYAQSQESLIINYCYSLIESIITSFAISFIIMVTRKIGLYLKNKSFYNISKYIDSKF